MKPELDSKKNPSTFEEGIILLFWIIVIPKRYSKYNIQLLPTKPKQGL